MVKILFIFIFFTSLLFTKQDKDVCECLELNQKQTMKKIKEASLVDDGGRIVISHPCFEDDNAGTIIRKMRYISGCFQSAGDSLNQYLSKVYLSQFYYLEGSFDMAKKEIDNIDNWAWNIQGTSIAKKEQFKEINQSIIDLKNKFYDNIENNSSDYATLTIRLAPSINGARSVSEGSLVDKKGTPINMEIFLSDNGSYLFDDVIQLKRFMYLKEEKIGVTFDHQLDDGSFDMQINYLPLLPNKKQYTILIKDEMNGILRRSKVEFTKNKKDEFEIPFSDYWEIKYSAAPDKINIWLPITEEYTIRVEDKDGHEEQASLTNQQKDNIYYNIYRLDSMKDKEADYDYKFIYQNPPEQNISFMKRWGWRWLMIGISAGILVNQMDN